MAKLKTEYFQVVSVNRQLSLVPAVVRLVARTVRGADRSGQVQCARVALQRYRITAPSS